MRLVLFSVLAFVALATSAAAEDLHIVAVRDDASVVLDRDSINRAGDTVRLRFFTYLVQPGVESGRQARWAEVQGEFDCVARRVRERVIAAFDHNAALIGVNANAAWREWQQVAPNSLTSAVEAFVCRDVRAPESRRLASLKVFPSVVLGRTTFRYYVSSRQDEEGWRALDMASIDAGGAIVGVTEMVLMPAPQTRDGVAYHWVEAETEYDCVGHRRRDRGVAALTLDLARRRGEGSAQFRPWRPNAPGSPAREAEDFLCRNVLGPSIKGHGDLRALQRAVAPGAG